MAIVEATIVPIGTNSTSVSKYVADAHKLVKNQEKIKYQLTPMGTIFEGDLNEILELIKQMHEIPFKNLAQRVSTIIKIDDRRDKESSMSQKLESVEAKL